MKNTAETRAQAQAALDYVTFNPHAHDQGAWVHVGHEDDKSLSISDAVVSQDKNVCNTVMCVAGTVKWLNEGIDGLSHFKFNEDDAVREAGEYLGLEQEERYALFFTFDNDIAKNMLNAVANGDTNKFWSERQKYQDQE